MKIIITGAQGQLGQELVKQLDEKYGYDVIKTDKDTLDITNIENVNTFILEQNPDVVINCAAHTTVDLCETDMENAYKCNWTKKLSYSV